MISDIYKRAKQICKLAVLGAVFALAGCGGGDSASTTSPTAVLGASQVAPISGQTDVTFSIIPQIDITLPEKLKSSIASIQSTTGSANPGKSLAMPGPAGTESLIFAVDTNQNPQLMAFANGDKTLSVNTTAIALVRIAADLIALPSGLTEIDVTFAINSCNSYNSLINAISNAINNQTNLSESMAVLTAVSTVAQEAQSTIQNRIDSNKIVLAKSLITTKSVVYADKVPFYIWNNSNTDKTWITDLENSPDIEIQNQTFLAWAISANGSDTQISSPLSNASALQLIGSYKGSNSTTKIAGNGLNEKLLVTVRQDDTSKIQNGINLTSKITFGIISAAAQIANIEPSDLQSCAIKISKSLVGTNSFAAFAAKPSLTTLKTYLNSIATDYQGLILTQCKIYDAKTLLNTTFKAWFNSYTVFLRPLYIAQATFQSGSILYQFINAADTPFEVNVCKFNGKVVPCTPITGSVSISGPVTIPSTPTSSACHGTMSVVGTSTLNTTSLILTLDVDENFTTNCFKSSHKQVVNIPLTQEGNILTGSLSQTFACDADCSSGVYTYDVSLQVFTDNGNKTAAGTLTHTNQNDGHLAALSTGQIVVDKPLPF